MTADTKRWPEIDPIRPCCGQRHRGVVCPDGLVMCQLCFERVPVAQLHQDESGSREDVCAPCADGERRRAVREAAATAARAQVVTFRVSPEDRETLEAVATALGVSLSQFIRTAVMDRVHKLRETS